MAFLLCLLFRLLFVFLAVIVLRLRTEEPLDHSYDKNREEAKKEGEDRGEEEAPPFPFLQTLLVINKRDPLWGKSLLAHPHGKGEAKGPSENSFQGPFLLLLFAAAHAALTAAGRTVRESTILAAYESSL